jgi:hypothetical protein
MKPLTPIFRNAWKSGCGLLALCLAASHALGQTAYDPYANSRARNTSAQASYNNSDQPPADAFGDANSSTIAGRPTNPPPRRPTNDGPRAGSRDYGAQPADVQPASPQTAGPPSDRYARPLPNRNPRSGAVRTSYDQSNPQSGYAQPNNSQPNYSQPNGVRSAYGQPNPQYARPPAQSGHPQGIVDSMTAQFSTPATPSDSSYGYRPRHVRMAMADETMPPPSNSRTPSSVVMPSPQGTPGSAMPESVEQGPMGNHPLAHGDMGMEYDGMQGGPEPGASCGCGGGGCQSCGGGCGSCCGPCCCLRQLLCLDCWWNDDWIHDFTVFGGVQSFKGPVDQGVNGDFGFHEGVNWGSPVWDAMGLGMQVGFGEYHSDLSRTNATDEHRNQFFFTTGLFHRPQCNCGWQGGLVFDYLNDSFVDDFSVGQIRGNVSYVYNCHEFGFEFTHGVHDTTFVQTAVGAATTTTEYHPIDLYEFYFAHHYCNGGEGRLFAGFTGGEGALLGADFSVPLSDKISLDTGFTYVIPKTMAAGALPPEFWNIGINLVWHPGCCSSAHDSYCSPYRPLFNVADNGSFMVNREVGTRGTGN